MSAQTGISWCDSTFNPWIGCTKVGPGCDHCYAERDMDIRRGRAKWGAGNPRSRTSAGNWQLPVRWDTRDFYECSICAWRGDTAEMDGPNGKPYGGCPRCEAGKGKVHLARRRVFCASLADVFDNEVEPLWRADLFDLIDRTPNLDWLLLTKRIGNVPNLMRGILRPAPTPMPDNVWLGATIVNQQEADRDIPKLVTVPARVRFLSVEPMLGHIDIGSGIQYLSWVIAGGESGPKSRPMQADWVRSLRDQCRRAGLPYHFKQWGEWTPFRKELAQVGSPVASRAGYAPITTMTPSGLMQRAGKKAAGRLLDGRTWDEFPRAAQ